MGIFVEVPRIGNIDIVLPLHRVRIVVLLLDSCHLDGRLFLSQLTHRNQVSQESKKQQAPSLILSTDPRIIRYSAMLGPIASGGSSTPQGEILQLFDGNYFYAKFLAFLTVASKSLTNIV